MSEIEVNNNPKISIITVSYNTARTIEQTILSVLNQTYSNIEYIIIDGQSTDSTVDIIKKYENKISYWVSEPDKGIYDAMNKGIQISSGDYIQFLGADDSLLNVNIIGQVAKELHSTVDILSTGIFMIDDELLLEKYAGNEYVQNKKLYDGSMIPHPGMFVKSSLMKTTLFNTQYKVAADYEFFLKCYINDEIVFKYISIATVYFSLMGQSSTSDLVKREHIEIMHKFGLSNELVKNVRRFNNKSLRYYIKKFLRKIHLISYILRLRGWRKHQCQNQICRWCVKC